MLLRSYEVMKLGMRARGRRAGVGCRIGVRHRVVRDD